MVQSQINRLKICLFILCMALTICPAGSALALSPDEVLVVANKNASDSEALARYYMKKRKIPKQNLIRLFMTDKETCTRKDYLTKAVPPIRKFLEKNSQIRAIVALYGIPLRIKSPGSSPEEKEKLNRINLEREGLETLLASDKITDAHVRKEKNKALDAIKKEQSDYLRQLDKAASFDSELSLVKRDSYDLNMWLPNPFYLGFRKTKTLLKQSEVLMTSRLDGPSPKTVKRIINDTLEAEKNGLRGNAVLDARWKKPETKKTTGYARYDQSLHHTADLLNKSKKIKVVFDQEKALFAEGSGLETALYCGWYSLAQYVDAFKWQKGSVGYHMASAECRTLKQSNSQVWCKKMLDNGIAATIGPVGEPYIQGFPLPQLFFGFLTEGGLTLAESYLVSLPFLSWKMVLVGDPLYRLNLLR